MTAPWQAGHRAAESAMVDYTINDPGDAGEIANNLEGVSPAVCLITTAAAETRTLADPILPGQKLILVFYSDGGDCTITTATAYNRAGSTTITLDTEGQTVVLEAIDTSTLGLRWQVTQGLAGADTTTALTTITPADAEGTPDYAIAAITNSTPFGFASAQEAITVLYVIKNLQTRLAEVEAILANAGLSG